MAKENCGCQVLYRHSPYMSISSSEIKYCSTHSAAFEMRETLRGALDGLRYFQRQAIAHDVLKPLPQCLAEIERVLSLAEGKEASDDRCKES